MNWKIGIVLGLLAMLLIFILQNQTPVKVLFLIWAFTTSRAMIIFITLLCGFAAGWLASVLLRKNN